MWQPPTFTNLLHEICQWLIHVLQNLWYFISLLRNSRHKHFLKLCCYSDALLCLKAFSTPFSSVPLDSPLLLLFIFCFIPLFPLAFKCFLSFWFWSIVFPFFLVYITSALIVFKLQSQGSMKVRDDLVCFTLCCLSSLCLACRGCSINIC